MSGAVRWLAWIVALGALARLARFGLRFPIWGDEAFVACSFLTRDFAGLFEPLEFEMVVPLGWLLPTFALSKLLGAEAWVLRLPALAAGLAAMVLFAAFARRALRRHEALVAVALFAASYYLVRYGAEVKPYAFDLLVGLLITRSAWRLLRSGGEARGGSGDPIGWIVFTCAASVGVWFSYPAAFVASGALLVLLPVQLARWRRTEPPRPVAPLLACLLATAVIAASFVAMYDVIGARQQWSEERIADARHWDDHFAPVDRPWLLPWWLLRELAGNMLAYPNGGPDFGSSATLLLVVTGAVAWWWRGRRREVLLLVSPLLPMLIASALRRYPFGGSARITLHLAVPVCLLAGVGLLSIARKFAARIRARRPARASGRGAARTAAFAFAAAMALFLAGTIARDVAFPFKDARDVTIRAAIAAIRDETRPGDRWIVFGHFGLADAPAGAAPGAPDLRSWRGSAARLRYWLLLLARESGAELHWAPVADTLDAAHPGSTWLLAYRDNEAGFPESKWTAYRELFVTLLGIPAASERHDFGASLTGREELRVLRWSR